MKIKYNDYYANTIKEVVDKLEFERDTVTLNKIYIQMLKVLERRNKSDLIL